jgi:hypothetical protein
MSPERNLEKYKLDPNRWIDTIPKKKNYGSKSKYYVTIIFFIFGIISISLIKNETRNLQKEINFLQTSIEKIKINLHESILDFNFITSPENISELSRKYLPPDFIFYDITQIKNVAHQNDINLTKKKDLNKKPISINAEYPFDVTDQALLDKRETNKINVEIDQISYKKFKNWTLTQIFKVFLGLPPIPGK